MAAAFVRYAASEQTHVLVTGADLGLEVFPVKGDLVGLDVGHQDEHEARAKDRAHIPGQERVVQTCATQPVLSTLYCRHNWVGTAGSTPEDIMLSANWLEKPLRVYMLGRLSFCHVQQALDSSKKSAQ